MLVLCSICYICIDFIADSVVTEFRNSELQHIPPCSGCAIVPRCYHMCQKHVPNRRTSKRFLWLTVNFIITAVILYL